MDPSLFCARCFATWLRVQILMAFLMAWLVVLLGVSGYLTESSGGSFSQLTITSAGKNGTSTTSGPIIANWGSDVCNSVPYSYLRPFAFSYTSTTGLSSTSASYCPYPKSLSTFRFCICSLAVVTIFILFFKTPLSFFARQIWITYALLFFASFVLDVNAVITGADTCHLNFVNTPIKTNILATGVSIDCTTQMSQNYAGLTIIDLVVCAHFFLLYTAWALAPNLYSDKPANKSDQKTILSMASQQDSQL